MKIQQYLLPIIGLAIFTSLTVKAQNRQPTTKANLLLIITDEHNFRTLGAYRDLLSKDQALMWGDTVVTTPNLDYLAKNGVLFNSMYASSPVCSPSRSSMFTGLYPQNAGVPQNNYIMKQDVPTLADVLTENGYETGYGGKWHLSGEDKPGWAPKHNYGFKDNRFMFNRGHWKNLNIKSDGTPYVVGGGDNPNYASKAQSANDKTFTTDWLTNRAIDFIDEHKTKPFFYVLSYPDPHGPDKVRPPYDTMYADVKFEMPKTFYKKIKDTDPLWQQTDPKKQPKKMQASLQNYFGMVKLLDDNLGRLISKLRNENLLDNTLLVFSSDHGDLLGEHHRINKGNPQEGSAKIPFVMHYPNGIKKGLVVHEAANTTDWMDTFLSLLAVKNYDPAITDGRDLTPLINKTTGTKWQDVTFVRIQGWVGAFSDRYKLVLSSAIKPAEPWLIDTFNDPDEVKNVIHLTENKTHVQALAKSLQEYGKQFKDPVVQEKYFQQQLAKLIDN
ncbi:sulfatase-like hydrolase/transferase [Paraglaciecola sp. L3A3]|uniref:sulfatase-like hydrolase/transferase n=1 Tax=Paraglaciecola sp. L3A3 TaxID=2686358 RepID=UPI0018EED021|nr:sulfatase-like hydrolase/transferase [Paraglaciecola sp. L3A3]